MKSIILKRRDQQNHLMDLNFNQQKGRISDHMYPFYRVFDERVSSIVIAVMKNMQSEL